MLTKPPSKSDRVELRVTLSLDDEAVRSLAVRLADAVAAALRAPGGTPQPPAATASRQHEPLLWTIREVAKALQVCEKSVYLLWTSKRMPQPLKFGRTLRWNADTVRQWIVEREREQSPGDR